MLRLFRNLFEKSAGGRGSNGTELRGDVCPAIEIVGLTVFRRHLPVLCNINLKVQHGEILAIMGPNGAGKSTLLKCLSGAMSLNRGEIRWSGISNARSPVVRRQIGYVGHECSSYGELTALENVTFAGRMHGVDRPRDHAMKLLRESGLGWAAHRRAGELSQGMRRRLAIARALVHNPVLILLDEPFASLDREGQRWLERLFRLWRVEGSTVCFACHEVCQSRLLADRIVWLDCGQVAAFEPSDADSPAVRRSA